MTRRDLMQVYRSLLREFGPQHWWPADSPFEVMAGAILTQNAAWLNVAKAIANLKRADALDARALASMDHDRLAGLIRPSGYYNVKAERLQVFVRWFCERYEAKLARMKRRSTPALRQELLAVRGIGEETADSILLYAVGRPVFVVDTYTRRVLSRHGVVSARAGYAEVQQFFQQRLPRDAALFNEYHALIVALGKDVCRPKPRCAECPLLGPFTRRGLSLTRGPVPEVLPAKPRPSRRG